MTITHYHSSNQGTSDLYSTSCCFASRLLKLYLGPSENKERCERLYCGTYSTTVNTTKKVVFWWCFLVCFEYLRRKWRWRHHPIWWCSVSDSTVTPTYNIHIFVAENTTKVVFTGQHGRVIKNKTVGTTVYRLVYNIRNDTLALFKISKSEETMLTCSKY